MTRAPDTALSLMESLQAMLRQTEQHIERRMTHLHDMDTWIASSRNLLGRSYDQLATLRARNEMQIKPGRDPTSEPDKE